MRSEANCGTDKTINKPDANIAQDRCKHQGEDDQKQDVMEITVLDSIMDKGPVQATEV